MQVLFVEDVPGTAYAGDIKNVKNGFGRNYLLPKRLAVLATPDQMNRVARLQSSASKRRDVAEKSMSAVAEKIAGATITIEVRAGRNNRLYGSITNSMIAEELNAIAGQEIDRRLVVTEPIRQLGTYEVPVKLGFGFEPSVTVRVAPIGGSLEKEATAEEVVADLETDGEAGADPRRGRRSAQRRSARGSGGAGRAPDFVGSAMVNTDRLPPQDVEAEEAVVGSLLIDSDALLKVATVLEAGDFSLPRTKACYDACLALFDRTEAINQVTVAQELYQKGVLEEIGGAMYLSHLVAKTPTSAHIEHYARIVHRVAMMRRLIEASEAIAAVGYEGGPDVDAALTQAEDHLFRLRTGEGGRDFVALSDILTQYLEDRRESSELRPDAPEIIPTGFLDLDKLLGGLQRSDLVILAARPSLGKSSLALNIAYNAANASGAHVALFSLEMGKEQLADRLLSSVSQIDAYRLREYRQGRQFDTEEGSLVQAIGELSDLPIWVDDTPLLNVVEMRSKARRLHIECGLDLIIIDYLQLMHGDGRGSGGNRVQEVSEISRSLKGLARDLDVPVLALSQLSRAIESRPDRRPMLSDLRESGSIEQDADVVMFIFREDMIHGEEQWEKLHPDRPYPKGASEIIVAKHRHGPIGMIKLWFDERITTFRNAAKVN